MSDEVTLNLGSILLVACLVAIFSRQMRLPYSVGLVAAGILLAVVPIMADVRLPSFWQYGAFLANSIVFILIGINAAHHAHGLLTQSAVIAIALGRAAAVYPICAAFSRSRLAVDRRYQHILVWGGLRGALALILALALPETLAERDEMIVAAFAVVAFSIFIQGLTMPPLIRRLRLVERQDAARHRSHS
jgi:NhaP-type Na+/H+ or K+/H+ antiporter